MAYTENGCRKCWHSGALLPRAGAVLNGVTIEGYTSHPGIRWLLKDPTTELLLRIDGEPDPGSLQRYRDWFDQRFSRCFQFFDGRFPDGWLVNPGADSLAVHLAAGITALQRLAMQPVRRAQVLEVEGDRMRLAVPGFNGAITQGAIRLAIQLLLEVDADPAGGGERRRSLEEEIEEFFRFRDAGVEQLRFALAADQLGIPLVATVTGFLEIGHGCSRRVLSNSLFGTAAPVASLASDKLATYLVLHRAGIPVPSTRIVNSDADLPAAAEALGWPLVVKPLDQSLRRGVTTDVHDPITLEAAFRVARNVSQSSVLLQQQVSGREFRLTAIGSSFHAARELVPAGVVGDGSSSVAELLERCNRNPLRGDHDGAVCRRISVGPELDDLLKRQGLTFASVPQAGRRVQLSVQRGLRAGGLTVDAADVLHPSYVSLLQRTARVLQLEVVGIDLITPDPSRPWWEVGARVLEANPRPGLDQHHHATPRLRMHQTLLRHGFSGSHRPWLVAVDVGQRLEAVLPPLERVLRSCLPDGTRLGVLQQGECTLAGEPLPCDATDKGQVGQALLADRQCGAALMAWRAGELLRYGRPCEQLDLAVLGEGGDRQVMQEILDADPAVVIWLEQGLEAFQAAVSAWRERDPRHRLQVLATGEELLERWPGLLATLPARRRSR
ncbi:MAG: hypothetical protein ACKO0M_13045 [Cyanobium sp.]